MRNISFHLAHTRPPLHKAPLSDLLPKGYLTTLRRTVERVRFRNASGDPEEYSEEARIQSHRSPSRSNKTPRQKQQSPFRSRSTSTSRQRRVRMGRASSSNEDLKAEPRVMPSAMREDRVNGKEEQDELQGSAGMSQSYESSLKHESRSERAQQYKQLNIPISTPEATSGIVHTGDDMLRLDSTSTTAPDSEQDGVPIGNDGEPHHVDDRIDSHHLPLQGQKTRSTTSTDIRQSRPRAPMRSTYELGRQSAISNPFPANLPLSIIRLVESYVNQFVSSEAWTPAQGEKGYLLVRSRQSLHLKSD
jgi:hypothetical protein